MMSPPTCFGRLVICEYLGSCQITAYQANIGNYLLTLHKIYGTMVLIDRQGTVPCVRRSFMLSALLGTVFDFFKMSLTSFVEIIGVLLSYIGIAFTLLLFVVSILYYLIKYKVLKKILNECMLGNYDFVIKRAARLHKIYPSILQYFTMVKRAHFIACVMMVNWMILGANLLSCSRGADRVSIILPMMCIRPSYA